nr:DUF308 domain-containing protein [Gryllotalpicola sp.]
MSSDFVVGKTAINGLRSTIGIGAAVALIAGILILVWPIKAALVVTLIVAIYAILVGVVNVGVGVVSRSLGGWAPTGHIVIGVLFIIVGVSAFFNLSGTTVWLGFFVPIVLGVTWIVDGIVAFTAPSGGQTRGWAVVVSAIVSIVAGILVALSALWSPVVFVLGLGIALVVIGVIGLFRAFAFGRS